MELLSEEMQTEQILEILFRLETVILGTIILIQHEVLLVILMQFHQETQQETALTYHQVEATIQTLLQQEALLQREATLLLHRDLQGLWVVDEAVVHPVVAEEDLVAEEDNPELKF